MYIVHQITLISVFFSLPPPLPPLRQAGCSGHISQEKAAPVRTRGGGGGGGERGTESVGVSSQERQGHHWEEEEKGKKLIDGFV